MKRFVLIAALTLLANDTLGAIMEIPLSYDDAWQKAVQAISLEGFDLAAIDKDSGTIQGVKSLGLDNNYLVCSYQRGATTSFSFRISLIITGNDDSSSSISIQGKGMRGSYQNERTLIFWKNQIHSEDQCESTGEMEFALLNKISGSPVSSGPYDALIRQLQNPSQLVRTTASVNIYNERVDNEELYKAVESALRRQLTNLNRASSEPLQLEIIRHAKALAGSGNLAFMPLLDELSSSPAKDVARYAKKFKKILKKRAKKK